MKFNQGGHGWRNKGIALSRAFECPRDASTAPAVQILLLLGYCRASLGCPDEGVWAYVGWALSMFATGAIT
jgi:hypothetical protein